MNRWKPLLLAGLFVLLSVPAVPAEGATVDLEALRAFFAEEPLEAGKEDLVLAYRVHGGPATLPDLLIDIRIDPAEDGPRLRYRLRGARAPRPERHFHMPIDLAALELGPGPHLFEVLLDSGGAVEETSEENNEVSVRWSPSAAPPAAEAPPERLSPLTSRSVALEEPARGRSWESPLEVGLHPGHGATEAVFLFPAPPSDRTAARLLWKGTAEGRPFQRLGPLTVSVQVLPTRRDDCPAPEAAKTSLQELREEVPLPPLPSIERRCAGAVEVRVSFPIPPEAERIGAGSLLRLEPGSVRLVFGSGGSSG